MTETSRALKISELGSSTLDYGSIEDAFPDVDPGLIPFGDKVLVQIRTPMTRTKGGIFVPEESRDAELWNTQVAKVISLGPVAFHNRDTLQPWPELQWCKEGDFVRVPKYGGDRWEVRVPNSTDPALFVLFRDVDLVGKITGDPLEMVAYLK
jgi:co-chaperonin GroES (HSP10)